MAVAPLFRKWADALRIRVGEIEKSLRALDRSRLYGLAALWAAFAVCLAIRYWYVFFNGPLNHIFSDPNRHWENGEQLFWPNLMGSIDPLVYQVWLKALQWLDHHIGYVYVVDTATGMLSMALPFFYYKALREVLPMTWALAAAVTIGFMPSLFMIYSYFMNETLLLALVACGFWLTLRAMRTQNLPTILAVASVWALAGYTRVVALPLAALCFAALASKLSWRKRAAFAGAIGVCFGVLAIPACWHSNKNLNFCAPFGSGYLSEIYRASSARTMRMTVLGKGYWVFTTPSVNSMPLAPVSDWHSARMGTEQFTVDPARGREDWERTARAYRENGPRLALLEDKIENAVMFFFDPSWPDWNQDYAWGWASYWNRWLWLPLSCAVVMLMMQARPNVRDGLIPFCGLALTLLLLVQVNAVMEGRYRKPAEPLLIAGAFILVHRRSTAGKSTKPNLPSKVPR
jgi:hypothetical protein